MLHEVSCCADEALDGYEQNFVETCPDVWGARNPGDTECQHALNYTEAVAFCNQTGGRLCTAQELENDCTRQTGCGHGKCAPACAPFNRLNWF